jgi:hypothetical protein
MNQLAGSREVRECASEVKFMVDPATAGLVRERARALLHPDPHGSGPDSDEYLTSTLYFDTADFNVYHRRGSYRRAKYRIRRYGQADGVFGVFGVFLERKLRTSDLLSKRRSYVEVGDLERLLSRPQDNVWAGHWFHQRVAARQLQPVCQVAYRRTARVGVTEAGPIRLTLDESLRGCMVNGPAFQDAAESAPLTERIIVEMKFRGGMPALFRRVVEEFALSPARVSKYRLGIEATRPDVAIHAVGSSAAQQACGA